MTIKVGDKIPSATLYRMGENGPEPVTTDDLCAGKKVVLFGVPGAFTPTCSAKHVPGYLQSADALKAKGVDTIACVLRDLSRHNRLLRYDNRGVGLSDWDIPNISLEGFVTDLETVVDAAGFDRFALLGMSMSCAISVAYAVQHPERLTHLVLYGGFARIRDVHDDEGVKAMTTLIAGAWGRDNPAIRNIFTANMMPAASREEQDLYDENQRLSVSAENAVRIIWAVQETDVTALLSEVRVPTLVIHCRDEPLPLEVGRSMAAAIPDSRFVVLEGRNHILLEHDPATVQFKEVLFAFLEEGTA